MTLIEHAMASVFPDMTPDQYSLLKADIKENGLREPITLHEGRIVDGRHRNRACTELGIEPLTREWNGNGSLVKFVFSLNGHRRHLTASQLAAIAAELLPQIEAEAKQKKVDAAQAGKPKEKVANLPPSLWTCPNCGHEQPSTCEACAKCHEPNDGGTPKKSRDKAAAAITGVSPRYVSTAKRLKEDSPEAFQAVKNGHIRLPTAEKIADLPAKEQAEAIKEAKANSGRIKDPDSKCDCEKLIEQIKQWLDRVDRMAKANAGHTNHSRAVAQTLKDCIPKVEAMARSWTAGYAQKSNGRPRLRPRPGHGGNT